MDPFSSVVSTTSDNLSKLSGSLRGDVLGSHTYRRAMAEMAPLFQPRFFSGQAKTSPAELVRSSFGRKIAVLPDELLVDLPSSKSEFSLWQGFECRNAASLESCEIRKRLAASEIHEIDARIQELRELRKTAFDQVAEIEREERVLERQAPAEAPEALAEGAAAAGTHSGSDGATGSGAGAGAGASAGSHSARAAARARRARRRTQPTLQAFYAPGDRIKSIATGGLVSALDFDAPFGTLAAAVGQQLQVWDLAGELTGVYETPGRIRCVRVRGGVVALGGGDAVLRLVPASEVSAANRTAGAGASAVGSVAGAGSVVGSESGAVAGVGAVAGSGSHIVYDDALALTLRGHIEPITALDWHHHIVTGSDDKTIRQWDPATGKCIQVLDVLSAGRKHTAPAFTTPFWGPNAPVVGGLQHYASALAAGTADGVVRLWDLRQGTVVRTLMGHTEPVSGLSFDDTQLVSSSLDRSVRIWDLRTSTVVDTWAYQQPVVSLHLDAGKIACATGEAVAHVYNRQTRQHLQVGPGDSEPDAPSIVAVCQRNGYLVEGRDGGVGVWAC